MNRPLSFCTFLSTLVGGQVNVEIPLGVNPEGYLVANVSLPIAGLENVGMEVYIGPVTVIAHSSAAEGSERGQTLIFNTSSSLFQLYDATAVVLRYDHHSYLSIGPESTLTQKSVSVAIIRDDTSEARLVVGSTFDFFESHCLPGSIIRMLNASHPSVSDESNHLDSRIHFGDYTISNVDFRLGCTLNRHLFDAPSPVLQQISRTIELNGGRPRDEPGIWDNCNQSTIAASFLPEIRITVTRNEALWGTIVYYQEDYIDIEDGDICRLRIQVAVLSDDLVLNPLRIPNSNVRISSN